MVSESVSCDLTLFRFALDERVGAAPRFVALSKTILVCDDGGGINLGGSALRGQGCASYVPLKLRWPLKLDLSVAFLRRADLIIASTAKPTSRMKRISVRLR